MKKMLFWELKNISDEQRMGLAQTRHDATRAADQALARVAIGIKNRPSASDLKKHPKLDGIGDLLEGTD